MGGHADGQLQWLRPQQLGCLIDYRQAATHAGAIGAPSIGQAQATRQTLEQAHLQARLQAPNLLRHRSLGHTQFLGGKAKVEVAGSHLEHAQGVERRQR